MDGPTTVKKLVNTVPGTFLLQSTAEVSHAGRTEGLFLAEDDRSR